MISDAGSFGHVGADGRVRCNTYPGHAPILNITVASTTVALCMAGEQPSADFAGFARELADAAEQFAAEAERLHAEHQAIERVRADSKAASEAA